MARTLFIGIGGLGASQLRATGALWWKRPGIIPAVAKIPGVRVHEGSGWNGFEGKGLAEAIAAATEERIVLCGHSFGVSTAISLSGSVRTPKYCRLLLIAPVWWDKPAPPCHTIVLQPQHSVFPKAEVSGVGAITIQGTDHNSICHAQSVIDFICEQVGGA